VSTEVASARASASREKTIVVCTAALLGGLAAVCCLLLMHGAAPVGAANAGSVRDLLPDLNPLEPREPSIQNDNGTWVLTFGAATDNLGEGPATIHASRPDTSAQMKATQIIERSDGSTKTRKSNAKLEYVVQPDHQHWHLLGFMTYELRTAAKYKFIRPSQKTGFCMMDDYDSSSYDPNNDPPNKPPAPVYTDPCHLYQPDALSVDEGVSVGYGDYYNPLLEGQSIDLTGVPDGLYYLVVRANAKKAIKESTYKNNASSIQFDLTHPNGPDGAPSMEILSTCKDTDKCPVPVSMTTAAAPSVPRTASAVTVRTTLSRAATISVGLRAGNRLVSQVHRQLRAGTSALAVPVPSSVRRPSRATLFLRASGPGLRVAQSTASVRLG